MKLLFGVISIVNLQAKDNFEELQLLLVEQSVKNTGFFLILKLFSSSRSHFLYSRESINVLFDDDNLILGNLFLSTK